MDIRTILDKPMDEWDVADAEIVNMAIEDLVEEIAGSDAKLSTKTRKKLPNKVFCGPNRSFPVNDCAHYTAALRLLGRYKGPGDKSKIRACIERRGRELKCKTASGDSNENSTLLSTIKLSIVDNINLINEKDGSTFFDAVIRDLYIADLSHIQGYDLESINVERDDMISLINDMKIRLKDASKQVLISSTYSLFESLLSNGSRECAQ